MRSDRQHHLDRDEVLTAAVGVAVDLGLPAVSAATVATRLAVRAKAVAALWRDDGELVAATFSHIVDAELAESEQEVLAHPSPVQQLAVLIRLLAEPVPHLDAVWIESWSLGRRIPPLGAAVRRVESAWHALVADVVQRGISAGAFLENDADQVATHLLAVTDGVNAYSLVDYRSAIDRLQLLHAVVRSHLGVTLPDAGEAVRPG